MPACPSACDLVAGYAIGKLSTWTNSRHLGDVFYPDCSRIMSNPAAGCPQIAGENREANSYVIPTVRLKEGADAGLNILRQNGVSSSVKVVS